jgi:hypothetical protein
MRTGAGDFIPTTYAERQSPSTWRIRNLEFRADVFNLFDSNDDDISYFYASRLPGEPAEGIEDIHFHPLEPRTVRVSMTALWE